MLLPISHEKMRVRRLPVVTLVLIALTIAIHAVTSFVEPSIERRVVAAIGDAEMIRREQPSLGSCPALARVAPDTAGDLDDAIEQLARLGEREPEEVQNERRARYDAACAALDDAVRALPAQRFGFVPARGNWYALVTATFLHADWWHVIGNMWFLFLCALALEDRWGRAAFPAYYVVAGVVATLAHYVTHASSPTPVVGASGAVAGAMGAFLVLFTTTKIRFVGVLGFRLLWFRAPAYVMLPLWALVEIGFAFVGHEGGTAHWAHVGGFVFGAAVAGVFRLAGIDRRLDDAVERAAVLGDDPRVDAARELVRQGRAAEAVALLSGLAKEKPESVHVQEALREATAAAPPTSPTSGSGSGARLSTLRAAPAAPRSSASLAVPVAPVAAPGPVAPTNEAPYFPAPPPRK